MTPSITAANRKWWVVVAMSGVMIALTLDFLGLAVALPEIGKDLDGIVDAALVRGQRGVMILGVVLCVIGAWTALWGHQKVKSDGRIHRVAHGFTLAHLRHRRAEPTASS